MTHINQHPSPTGAVHAWHAAVNGRDAAAAADLCAAEVRVGGPKGDAIGTDALCDWVERSGIRLDPLRTWVRPGHEPGAATVVIEQAASWPHRADSDPDPDAGAVQRTGSVFEVDANLITRVSRYDTLPAALDAAGAGLTPAE